jgi:GNAT superfamily N-acetyltransferase
VSAHFIPQVALRGDFCRVSYLCVAENAPGKGIGVALQNEAVALARRRACDRLDVHCQVGREAAQRFNDRQR